MFDQTKEARVGYCLGDHVATLDRVERGFIVFREQGVVSMDSSLISWHQSEVSSIINLLISTSVGSFVLTVSGFHLDGVFFL